MPSTTIDRARALIQARLAELQAEAKGLERALSSLGGSAASSKRPGRPKRTTAAAQPKRRRRIGKGSKRAPRGQRREQLLAAVKAKPGARPAEIAGAIGITPAQAHNLIARARKDKAIVKKGKGYVVKG